VVYRYIINYVRQASSTVKAKKDDKHDRAYALIEMTPMSLSEKRKEKSKISYSAGIVYSRGKPPGEKKNRKS